MRKKIFIIHGKGERDGIGKNAGGDLDTISSNVFYGVWAENQVAKEKGGAATYGEDYEFDFINYSQGMSHLGIHRGCDIYIPDFPIDALAPRLKLLRIRNPYEYQVRKMLADFTADLLPTAHTYHHALDDTWKTTANDLFTKTTNILDKRSFFEIEMAAFGTYFTTSAIIALGTLGEAATGHIHDIFVGQHFKKLRNGLDSLLQSKFKQTILEAIPQTNTRLKLAMSDSIRADFGVIFRNKGAEQITVSLVEAVSIIASTSKLLAAIGSDLSPAEQEGLKKTATAAREFILESLQHLEELFALLHQSAAGQEDIAQRMASSHSWVSEARSFIDNIDSFIATEADSGPVKILRAMLVEESNGSPVPGVEIHFRLRRGEGEVGLPDQPGSREAVAITDETGGVAVELRLPSPDAPFEVFVTFDDMVFLPYRDSASAFADPEETQKKLPDSVTGATGDKIEQGTAIDPDLALRMSCQLIARDVRYLAENDVRIVRFDDHHPYTPVILETLQGLKNEGLIGEIQLSSLPRGEELPKDQQKCGADLIYETFVQGTPADNDGLALLRDLAHVQDLHIREEELAIDLSKLLGSKVDKIHMVMGLMNVTSIPEMADIMKSTGWGKRVSDYEKRLGQIIHRVDSTLSCIHLLLPPEEGDFGKNLGWRAMLKPFVGVGAKPESKQHKLRKLYAENPVNSVRFFTALSPFCNPKLGEPQINVASCINHLKQTYDFDYFFYNYGSFLMTTRRVNEESFKVDLNETVSFVGSKADGGHAEAASGRPSANPDFPHAPTRPFPTC